MIIEHYGQQDSVKIVYDKDSSYRKSVSVIKNGKQNGLYKTYYKNGKTKEVGLLNNDRKEGLWMFFDMDSVLIHVAHFSNDSIVVELDKSDFDFVQKDIADSNCKFSIPSGWEIQSFDDTSILVAIKKPCRDSISFCANFIIELHHISHNISLMSIVDNYSKILRDRYENLAIIYKSDLRINKLNAIQMGVRFKKNNLFLGSIITFIKDNNNLYILFGTASSNNSSEFFKYKGLFEQISASFKSYD